MYLQPHFCLQDFYLEDVLKFIGYQAPDSHHQDEAEKDSGGKGMDDPLAKLQRSATEQAIMDAFLKGDEGSWERLLEVTGAHEGSGNPACINVAHQATGDTIALLGCHVCACLPVCLFLFCLPVCLPVCPSVCLSVFLSVCLSVRPSLRLHDVCLPAPLSFAIACCPMCLACLLAQPNLSHQSASTCTARAKGPHKWCITINAVLHSRETPMLGSGCHVA